MVMQHSKLQQFEQKGQVGDGTYGQVYKAVNKETKQVVALKKIKLESDDEGIPSTAIREISLLKELNHPNVVRLHEVIHGKKELILVLQFVDMDLKKYMNQFQQTGGIDPVTLKGLVYQIIKGNEICHRNKILHRDLQPQNLLVTNEGVVKLADFGLARGTGLPVQNYTPEVVTLWYRPPDVLLGSKNYNSSIDIWSIGCIFAELINLKPFFPGTSDTDQLRKIFQITGTPKTSDWPGLADLPNFQNDLEVFPGEDMKNLFPKLDPLGLDLLCQMLRNNPAERITAQAAAEHGYFADLPDQIKKIYDEKK